MSDAPPPADPVAGFVTAVTASVRRSLYQRLKSMPLSQTELTAIISTAAKLAIERAHVAELATLAVAGGAAAEAYGGTIGEEDPLDPTLETWRDRKNNASSPVRELFRVEF